jgi:DNA-binding FadR family transcriptional regulator
VIPAVTDRIDRVGLVFASAAMLGICFNTAVEAISDVNHEGSPSGPDETLEAVGPLDEIQAAYRRRQAAVGPLGSRANKASMRVSKEIARAIAVSKLRPGTSLPSEPEMEAAYGVGRSTIREALRLLEMQGLVVIRTGPRGGPIVAAPDGRALGEILIMYLQVAGTPFGVLAESVVAIEGLVAGRAARNITWAPADHLQTLHAVADTPLSTIDDNDAFKAMNFAFHEAIEDLAGNRLLSLLAESVIGILTARAIELHHYAFDADQRRRIHKEHVKLARAVLAGSSTRSSRLAESHMAAQLRFIVDLEPGLLEEIVDWRS